MLCGEALLLSAAGGEPRRMGNEAEGLEPHGVFACKGEERWLSIAARSDEERAVLQGIVGGLSDEAITAWASTRDANEAAALLQAAGIAAHTSWTTPEIAADPHLRARRAIVDVTEPGGNIRAAVGVPMRLSKGPEVGIHRGTPQLGEDEDYVYGDLLGIGRDERRALEDAEVIY
jgi:crotonobetainyl-CoA:carnitine CoA-transferase CaiB-like acyl-CoA transferase